MNGFFSTAMEAVGAACPPILKAQLLLGLCLLFGCGKTAPPNTIRDLQILPQDARSYITQGKVNLPLLTPDQQLAMLEQLHQRFFQTWTTTNVQVRDDVVEQFRQVGRLEYFDSSKSPIKPQLLADIQKRSKLDEFPNHVETAITVKETALRDLPTLEPMYESFDKPGGGAPFDMLQNTALPLGTPLLVVHVAGSWAKVRSPLSHGWMPITDLAAVDKSFIKTWMAPPLAAIISDSVTFYSVTGTTRARLSTPHANIGTILPTAGYNKQDIELYLPLARPREDGQLLAKANIARVRAEKSQACQLPCPITPAALATVANEMLGQPYGWGGLQGDRDCSSTTHDLLVPFGLYLPRNSSQQARAGTVVALARLTPQQKEQQIISRGKPWLTLLRSPGHIMLYIGQHDGRAVMLHNFWGVKTRDNGKEGRHVIGRCAITTLSPGSELPNLLPRSTYVDTMESMILLAGDEVRP